MRDPARIDRVLALLRRAWLADPDMRLGQLVYNVVREHVRTAAVLFQVEDDIMERALVTWINRREAPDRNS